MKNNKNAENFGLLDDTVTKEKSCATWWLLILVLALILISAGLVFGVLVFEPEFIYGNDTKPVVIPTPMPTPPFPTPPPPTVPPTPIFPPFPKNNTGPCCVANTTFGQCSDQQISNAVCASGVQYQYCCDTVWDNVCIEQSLLLGLQTCSTQDCCLASRVVGCADIAIQQAVCQVDTSCCTRVWDKTCVGIAIQQGITTCSSSSCCTPSTTQQGCANSSVAMAVCEISKNCCFRSWSATCVGIAVEKSLLPEPCSNQPCCVSGIPNPVSGHYAQGCESAFINELICKIRPSCCRWQWTDECAALMLQAYVNGSIPFQPMCVGNDCCNTSSRGGCNSLEYMHKVCVQAGASECCGNPHGWTRRCVDIARSPVVGNPVLPCDFDSCCLSHSRAGCKDENVTKTVCSEIPSCCTQSWRGECVYKALNLISSGNYSFSDVCPEIQNESCCERREGAGCQNIEVMKEVCFGNRHKNVTLTVEDTANTIPSCCDVIGGWREGCVESAISKGIISCSNASCCKQNLQDQYGCNNPEIMKRVCKEEPFCCNKGQWGTTCSAIAIHVANSSSQCESSENPSDFTMACCQLGSDFVGCNDIDIVRRACEQSPSCCNDAWQGYCPTHSIITGNLTCNPNGTCFQTNYGAGCSNLDIQRTVCGLGTLAFEDLNTSGGVLNCPIALPLADVVVEKLSSCCYYECEKNSDCGFPGNCASGSCCETDNTGVCIGCGCTEATPMIACQQSLAGIYLCPPGINGTCVNYYNGDEYDTVESVQCCQSSYCFESPGWDSTCASAALCLAGSDEFDIGNITQALLYNDVPICTDTDNGQAGCQSPELARNLCGAFLQYPHALGISRCCLNETQNAQNVANTNQDVFAGWNTFCAEYAVAFGLATCSQLDCCDCTCGNAGCDNITVNQMLCTTQGSYVDQTGYTYPLENCCRSWGPECVNAAVNLGILQCQQYQNCDPPPEC